MSTATVLLLGACTGDGSSGPTPPTGLGTFAYTPSPEPSPTETPAPETVHPDRPDAMDQDGVEGAEATARYFLELYGYVYTSYVTDEWERMSHAECEFCSSVNSSVQEARDAGETTTGGSVRIEVLDVEELATDAYEVRFRATQAPWEVHDTAGDVIQTATEEKTSDGAMITLRVDGEWQVRAVDFDGCVSRQADGRSWGSGKLGMRGSARPVWTS